jgi:ribosome-binding factor A
MQNLRIQKVNSLLKKLITASILTYIDSNDFDIITVTDVATNPDFSRAIVWISALRNSSKIIKTIEKKSVNIQRDIASQVDFRKMPKLVFKLDETYKLIELIDKLPKSSQ